MDFIFKLLLNALAVFIFSFLMSGVHVDTYATAIFVAVALALLNVLVKPILIILTLPITLFTLGLFLLIINALIIIMVDYLVEGFSVSSLWSALLFGVLMSLLQPLLNAFLEKKEK